MKMTYEKALGILEKIRADGEYEPLRVKDFDPDTVRAALHPPSVGSHKFVHDGSESNKCARVTVRTQYYADEVCFLYFNELGDDAPSLSPWPYQCASAIVCVTPHFNPLAFVKAAFECSIDGDTYARAIVTVTHYLYADNEHIQTVSSERSDDDDTDGMSDSQRRKSLKERRQKTAYEGIKRYIQERK